MEQGVPEITISKLRERLWFGTLDLALLHGPKELPDVEQRYLPILQSLGDYDLVEGSNYAL
jgi:hypothetical protein